MPTRIAPEDARPLIDRYCDRFGVTWADAKAQWWGVYDVHGLAAAIAFIDQTGFRYVTDWYAAEGRRGKTAAAETARFARSTAAPVVGWITPANTAARRWVRQNGGAETVVADLVVAVVIPSA